MLREIELPSKCPLIISRPMSLSLRSLSRRFLGGGELVLVALTGSVCCVVCVTGMHVCILLRMSCAFS
jgi:hypothetical protein